MQYYPMPRWSWMACTGMWHGVKQQTSGLEPRAPWNIWNGGLRVHGWKITYFQVLSGVSFRSRTSPKKSGHRSILDPVIYQEKKQPGSKELPSWVRPNDSYFSLGSVHLSSKCPQIFLPTKTHPRCAFRGFLPRRLIAGVFFFVGGGSAWVAGLGGWKNHAIWRSKRCRCRAVICLNTFVLTRFERFFFWNEINIRSLPVPYKKKAKMFALLIFTCS